MPKAGENCNNLISESICGGITAAVIGALTGAVIIINEWSIVDLPTILIAAGTILSLLYFKKMQEPVLILIGAVIGIAIKFFFA